MASSRAVQISPLLLSHVLPVQQGREPEVEVSVPSQAQLRCRWQEWLRRLQK
jgi:hypothetical protein